MPSDRLLARVTLPADAGSVPALRSFMMQAARGCLSAGEELEQLGALVEEVTQHVVRTAFDPGEEGEYTAELTLRRDQVVFAIEDKGLPVDYQKAPPAVPKGVVGLAPFLPTTLANAVTFRNLGRGGKRLEVARNIGSLPAAAEHMDDGPADPPQATDEVVLRLVEPADAAGLSRLMYRAYGYTYGSEFVYYPERIAEMLHSGDIVSYVAANQAGEIVGHLALLLHGRDARSGETAMAAVDPRYRGRRLFECMKDQMRDLARCRGLFGLYSEAVAVHTFTQKGNLALGGFETGFLLGFTPATQVFRKISDRDAADRRSAVLFYLRTNEEPYRSILAPRHHHAMIQAIVHRGSMNRDVIPEPVDRPLHALRGEPTEMDVLARPDVARAFLTIRRFGGDVLQRVLQELRDLCRKGFACVYLELPLFDPMTAVLCKGFESFGFFFAGVLFETEQGDALRLQYLNGVSVRPDDIQVASDFGRSLLGYVMDARDAVDRARGAAA